MPGKRGTVNAANAAKLDATEVVAEYCRGDTMQALGKRHRVARDVLATYLRSKGVEIRSHSEALKLAFARIGPEGRQAMTRAAHDAVRGMTRTLEDLTQRAQSKQATAVLSGYEAQLAGLLDARGLTTVPQQAIGPYNADLGAYPVAVEIFGGQWHFSGRHLARLAERTYYLLNAGWHVLVVHVVTGRRWANYPITEATADYVVTFVDQARRHPAACREYRMVRGAGQLIATFKMERDELPPIEALVPPKRARR